MPVTWSTKLKWHAGFSADSVEWCPVEPYTNVLVCGTYQLEKKDEGEQSSKQKRLGKMYLFIVDDKTTVLSPIQSVDTAGILDQKWCHHLIQDNPVLAVVTSEGFLHLYILTKVDEILNLKLWISHSVSQDSLALSLDWCSNKHADDERLVISDSSGDVTVVKLVESILQRVGVWKAHDYEAWIVAFNYWNPHIFYSGGDDCLFKCYDVRLPDVPFSLNRSHDAGVTAIRNHVDVEHQLLTGSYDEKVRLWDTRNLRKCVTERNVNGGVWRLKWHPYRPSTVLAACMYGGYRLLHVEQATVDVVCEYLEHDSIAYGADWQHDHLSLVATCSFYDCKLHISEISM